MGEALVSVIISAYNHEKYIGETLKSIINQTYTNIELILFNDGSKDKTHEVIISLKEELNKRFTDFHYFSKENEGISKTFNRGIKLARGKYIKVFGSDDILYPNAISELVIYMERYKKYGAVFGNGYHAFTSLISLNKKRYSEDNRFSKQFKFKSGYIHRHIIKNLPLIPTITVMFRKEVLDELGGYDENLPCEDIDLYVRMSNKYMIGFMKKNIAIHRLHDDNNGLKPEIMLPTLNAMLKKYDVSGIFKDSEERKLFLEVIYWVERVLSSVNWNRYDFIKDKKIIAWGTGGLAKKYLKNFPFEITYFVDKNPKKQFGKFENYKVLPPHSILKEKREEIFVVILSSFYQEIDKWLQSRGLVFKKHYY
ncbi:hypothetical protein CVD28_09295 [Bacillus sp. M6-12]|uniref:glycosyltransferase family 2 protein n=1 Tax=Bacillus sp. M6-12 TaxID=2054166 RepID=UPI000C784E1A|nr:glycosyltransferase [Bacillus sp. M6-12]PLS17878.1 hypothetical protein CVD28_09295 [Bacillus sp. M6-12]